MECKQTLITNTPSSLHTLSPLSCFPVPSPPIARSPLSGQRRSLGQCVVVPPSVAVPLESGLVGPARAAPWLWPLFRHGFLHSPPPTWSFFCVCAGALCLFLNASFSEVLQTHLNGSKAEPVWLVIICGLWWVRWNCMEPAVSSTAVTFPQSSALQPPP